MLLALAFGAALAFCVAAAAAARSKPTAIRIVAIDFMTIQRQGSMVAICRHVERFTQDRCTPGLLRECSDQAACMLRFEAAVVSPGRWSEILPVRLLEAVSVFQHAGSRPGIPRSSACTLAGVHVLGDVIFALRKRLLVAQLLG